MVRISLFREKGRFHAGIVITLLITFQLFDYSLDRKVWGLVVVKGGKRSERGVSYHVVEK